MKLAFERIGVVLRHPFRIARSVMSDRDVFVVTLTWRGFTGMGESAPPAYYGETPDTVTAAFERVRDALDGDPETLRERIATGDLYEKLEKDASVRAALDMALWDLTGKRDNVPLYEVLGIDPAKTPATSFSIGIDSPEVIDIKVAEAAPYHILKMKMGVPGDLALLDRVIERTGRTIRVDANEGWDIETALDMGHELAQRGVEFIEQPIHHEKAEDLRTLKRLSPLPVMLDESVIAPTDVARCHDQGHGINVKLMKCGGITPAITMIEEARSLGLKVMLGCMIETSLGITAAAHLSPLVDYADLDGNLLVADDPFVGVDVQNSKLVLPAGPGLGVTRR